MTVGAHHGEAPISVGIVSLGQPAGSRGAPGQGALSALKVIALVGYDGVQALDLIGPADVFALANKLAASRIYEVIVASAGVASITSGSGVCFAGCTALENLPSRLDTVVVGGSSEAVPGVEKAAILEWLRAQSAEIRRIVSLGSGTFLVAETGLLDGRRATVHGRDCERLRLARPAVHLEPDAIFVADGPFYSAGGTTALIDLCLALVEKDCGPALAFAVAQSLVLTTRRAGGQSQCSVGLAVQETASPRLRMVLAEILQDPVGDLGVLALAGRLGMAERTLTRAFVRYSGFTPAAYVETARLNRAKVLLETSDWPLARVAERAGFGSAERLHRAFRRHTRTTPREYRLRFGLALWSSGAREERPGHPDVFPASAKSG